MRFFANLFLILFLADGGISLLDEVVSRLSALLPLSGLRNLEADALLLMAAPLYVSLGIDRRLPKPVFLPLILFLFASVVTASAFPSVSHTALSGLLMSAGQVALGLLPVYWCRRNGHPGLTLPKSMFDAPFFSLKNSLIFGAANVVVLPCAAVLVIFCMANSFISEYTGGFMRLAPDGLRMTERVYRRGAKTVRLAGMIHVGEKRYYDDLVGSIAPGRTIVLAEGVTDDDSLLRNRLDYGKVAGFLGLASQEKVRFKGREIDEEEFENTHPGVKEGGKTDSARPPEIFRSDVDISTFRPSTIRFIDELGKQLKENGSVVKGLLSFNAWAEKNITPEMNKTIMDDILYRRNREVIRHLRTAVDRYDTVVVPWGALHMPEIEAEVLKLGFQRQQERERVSIDFRRLVKGI